MGMTLPLPFEIQAFSAIRYEFQMTPGMRDEYIEGSRIGPLSYFSHLYENTDCRAQRSRAFEQGIRPKMRQIILSRPAHATEP